MEYLKDLVPLLQTLSWVMLILILAFIYRKEARIILEKGGLKIGPGGIEIAQLVTDLQNDVSELNERVSKQFLTAMGPECIRTYISSHIPLSVALNLVNRQVLRGNSISFEISAI